jgi:hypothetical protein
VVVVAQAEAMPEQAMADSVAVVDVANRPLREPMLSQAMVGLAGAGEGLLQLANKARAAPLLWLSSGEVSRHEIRIPE